MQSWGIPYSKQCKENDLKKSDTLRDLHILRFIARDQVQVKHKIQTLVLSFSTLTFKGPKCSNTG